MARRAWHCEHCGAMLGRVRPSAAGGRTLVMRPRAVRAVEEPDDAPRRITCRACGEQTAWDGDEIKWPKAA